MQPVSPRERIVLIDVLRGIALIGIIIANMRGYNSPMEAYMQPGLMWDGVTDRATTAFIDLFVTGKFITIFCILFGLGFAIQLERTTTSQGTLPAVYLRRMLTLALFGAAHVVFLWWGDILLTYALMGIVLLVIFRQIEDSLLMWTLILYLLPVLLFVGLAVISPSSGTQIETPHAPPDLERVVAVYTQAGFPEILAERVSEWQSFNASWEYSLPRILGCFLFGAWLWRRRLFQEPGQWLGPFRKIRPWLFAIGLAGNATYVAVNQIWKPDPAEPSGASAVMWLSSSAGVPALSLFYIVCVVLIFQSDGGRRLLTPFAAVGRMALTNYLLQSVVCTFLFYGYGLGLFGKIHPLAGIFFSLAVYFAQVLFSVWWLRRFRFGPLEWLWRFLTYGRLYPARTSP